MSSGIKRYCGSEGPCLRNRICARVFFEPADPAGGTRTGNGCEPDHFSKIGGGYRRQEQ